jgi:hypothetical protein
VWGAAPASGEAWLRSMASAKRRRASRARRARERESSGREREGEARPFIERERERRGHQGERGRPAINGAISDTAAVHEGEGREKREGSQWGPPVREREGRKVRAHGLLGPGGPK